MWISSRQKIISTSHIPILMPGYGLSVTPEELTKPWINCSKSHEPEFGNSSAYYDWHGRDFKNDYTSSYFTISAPMAYSNRDVDIAYKVANWWRQMAAVGVTQFYTGLRCEYQSLNPEIGVRSLATIPRFAQSSLLQRPRLPGCRCCRYDQALRRPGDSPPMLMMCRCVPRWPQTYARVELAAFQAGVDAVPGSDDGAYNFPGLRYEYPATLSKRSDGSAEREMGFKVCCFGCYRYGRHTQKWPFPKLRPVYQGRVDTILLKRWWIPAQCLFGIKRALKTGSPWRARERRGSRLLCMKYDQGLFKNAGKWSEKTRAIVRSKKTSTSHGSGAQSAGGRDDKKLLPEKG